MEHAERITVLLVATAYCVLFAPSRCLGGPSPPPLKYGGTRGQSPVVKRVQFHVLLRPQREECFYEEGFAGSYHAVYYQVMGEDAIVRFALRGPPESETFRESSGRGHQSVKIETDGEYSYCFFNINRMYLKLNFMLTIVDKNKERQLYRESLDVPEEFRDAWNATLDLRKNVDAMHAHIFQQRRQFHYDMVLVEKNGQFVAYWSFAQCCIIVLASVIQVFVFRTMFRTVAVTPTNKPRS